MKGREFLYKYKGNKCGHCGRSVKEMIGRWGTVKRVFELNHVDDSKKHPDYSSLIRRAISTEQLDEADKCVLLCVECHKALHAQGVSGILTIAATFPDGRIVEQRLQGQILTDFKAKKRTFFTDEVVKVLPYQVQLGRGKPLLLAGLELEADLFGYFKRTRKSRTLTIRGHDGTPLLIARRVDDLECRVEFVPSFPLLSFEGQGDDGRAILWARRGKIVSRDQENPADLNISDEGTVTFHFNYETPENPIASQADEP